MHLITLCVSLVSMMATHEYENMKEQLDLEQNLRQKAETYAHEVRSLHQQTDNISLQTVTVIKCLLCLYDNPSFLPSLSTFEIFWPERICFQHKCNSPTAYLNHFLLQMLVKQKEANRQSMILLQQVDPSIQLLKALEDVASVTKTLEEERQQHQEKVNHKKPNTIGPMDNTGLCDRIRQWHSIELFIHKSINTNPLISLTVLENAHISVMRNNNPLCAKSVSHLQSHPVTFNNKSVWSDIKLKSHSIRDIYHSQPSVIQNIICASNWEVPVHQMHLHMIVAARHSQRALWIWSASWVGWASWIDILTGRCSIISKTAFGRIECWTNTSPVNKTHNLK